MKPSKRASAGLEVDEERRARRAAPLCILPWSPVELNRPVESMQQLLFIVLRGHARHAGSSDWLRSDYSITGEELDDMILRTPPRVRSIAR